MQKETIQTLIETAIRQLEFAYTPYSHFKVGAALLAENGEVYTGCNIENAAYTPCNCAERTAFFKAVSEGVRSFRAICIVGGMNGELSGFTAPCGVCRQVMMEFCDPETFEVILAAGPEDYRVYRLKELLPMGFGPSNLKKWTCSETGGVPDAVRIRRQTKTIFRRNPDGFQGKAAKYDGEGSRQTVRQQIPNRSNEGIGMETYKRIFVIVIDSLGIGAMPDSERFGDIGVNTLGHISESVETFRIPNLQRLGLANLTPLRQVPADPSPMGYHAVLREKSNAKDTMTGHWEMMGLETTTPFQTFTDHGFPPDLIAELERRTGHKVIGNKSASGTEILDELAEEEIATGHMIVYTSADSVLQICGNEETFGLDELYRCCEIARELTLRDEWKVGRVIARPYIGRKKGSFERTSNRHDYALKPSGKTALDALKAHGLDVISIGKIRDIFDGEGITQAQKSKSSVHGMEQTIETAKQDFHGLCFVNLVDFDAKWGHRRNPQGYAEELERFDEKLGILLKTLREDDLLFITADHGTDPTYTGTDHTREKVPLLAWSPSMQGSGRLAEQETFAVIGATAAENFGVPMPEGTIGASLLSLLH